MKQVIQRSEDYVNSLLNVLMFEAKGLDTSRERELLLDECSMLHAFASLRGVDRNGVKKITDRLIKEMKTS